MRRDLYSAVALGVIALGFDSPAFAAPDPSELDEVIVTARRAEENLQSVPVSVQAFTAEAIREQGIRSANDLMKFTPGIYTFGAASPLNTKYSIRGQGQPVAGNAQAGVVSYFAEVPLPTVASASPQYDLANIQVLKGPQGTLFGKNTLGGAVLTTPNAPTYDFSGYIQGTVGNYNWHEIEGAINIPIVQDRVALRIAGRWARRDGYVKNLGGDREAVSDMHDDGYRVSLLVEPTKSIKNTLIFDYEFDDNNGPGGILGGLNTRSALYPTFKTFLDAQAAARAARGPRVTDTGQVVPREFGDRWGVTNRTEITPGDGSIQLINILGYRNVEFFSFGSADGLPELLNFPAPGSVFRFLDVTSRTHLQQFTEEMQLRGEMFDGKLSWLLGGFYLKEKPDGRNIGAFTILNGPAATYTFPTTTSKAIFGNLSYDLSDFLDGLKLNLGYRYTWDKVSLCTAGAATNPFDPTVTLDSCLPTNPSLAAASIVSSSSKAPTWTVGLDYQVNDDLFLYVTSRRGYRAGGVNSPKLGTGFAAYQGFEPETVTDIEAGLRSDWRAGDVTGRFNLSVFSQKNKKAQVPISGLSTAQFPATCLGNPPSPPWIDGDCNRANDPATGTLIFNTGELKVQGIEFDAVIRPLKGLTVRAAGTIMDQKVLNVKVPPVGAAVTNPSDIFFQVSPEKGYTFDVKYVLPTAEALGEISVGAHYNWTSSIRLRALTFPGYGTLDFRADWRGVNGLPVDLGAFVRNATDNEHLIASSVITPTLPWFSVIYNDPRLYGLELRYHW